ncbi:YibE/F family protein [Arthrobacter sp. I2-34]|uniref:YibE/F family protein n=1 Tax=Arthrobacter hankyongi TaxID=2904801 RepID=A0ABS9LD74_9MICC|nr:YibE/F family protein [Arthrobacter hankyongi]MCG2624453.1 YibE/F family protein [Arthrobacter hankyongi]
MGHAHSHPEPGKLSAPARAGRRRANVLLTAVLVPLAVLTVLAMALMWPGGDRGDVQISNPYATAPGVDFVTGTVQQAGTEDCPSSAPAAAAGGQIQQCLVARTLPDGGGAAVPVEITPEIAKSHGVEAGDRIRYLDLSGVMDARTGAAYVFVDFVRTVPVALLAVLYAVVVIAVARWRGLRAIIGLVGAYAILATFVLPALLEGRPALPVALVGSVAIMFGVLYFAHGFSARTSTALLGTLFGLGITALLAAWSTGSAYLTGAGDENTYQLINASDQLSISGMITCGLVISGLGVLNDVTITQSSAVWELHELAPHTSARSLFASAMRIGRDHIASTVYTIAFAYAGAALPVLILVLLYDRPLLDALTTGQLAEEVVRTLAGSIGLVLAVPVTTAVAVLVVKATARDDRPEGARPEPGAPDPGGTAQPVYAGVPDTAPPGTVPESRRARRQADGMRARRRSAE